MVLLPKVFTNVILEKNFSKKTNYKPHINITSVSLSLSLSHTLALGHGFPCLTFPDRDFKLRSQLPSHCTPPPNPQSLLWSQNSALPILNRIRGDADVVFPPPWHISTAGNYGSKEAD